jgi:hypothetical protein
MSTEPPHIDMSCRAALEETERWWRDRGDHARADRVRRYLDYIALPTAQRRALDEAHELRQDQLRHLIALCEDRDIALMAATDMLSATSADALAVRCCDGPRMHCADVDSDGDGRVQVAVTLDGEWPYQRPVVGSA